MIDNSLSSQGHPLDAARREHGQPLETPHQGAGFGIYDRDSCQ